MSTTRTIADSTVRKNRLGSRYSSSLATIFCFIAIWKNPWTDIAKHKISAGKGLYSTSYISACNSCIVSRCLTPATQLYSPIPLNEVECFCPFHPFSSCQLPPAVYLTSMLKPLYIFIVLQRRKMSRTFNILDTAAWRLHPSAAQNAAGNRHHGSSRQRFKGFISCLAKLTRPA